MTGVANAPRAETEPMNPRTLKLIVLGYVVKTALVGLAWLAVPDLPQRALTMARETWSRVTSTEPAGR